MTDKIKNLWSLEKDISIKTILILLQHEFGPEAFMLLDEEMLNEKAVRIVSPTTQHELSAYLYSYAQREGHYGLDLEFPFLIETRADDQTIRLNDLDADTVIKQIAEHLEITS